MTVGLAWTATNASNCQFFYTAALPKPSNLTHQSNGTFLGLFRAAAGEHERKEYHNIQLTKHEERVCVCPQELMDNIAAINVHFILHMRQGTCY